MKLNKLKSGMVFKNYKELCSFLEVEATGGRTKEYRLINLGEFCDFSQTGRAFTINRIYPPKPKLTTKGGRVYQEDLFSDMLILTLSKVEDNSILINTRNLIEMCGFVNSRYFKNHDYVKEYSKFKEIEEDIARDVFSFSHDKLYRDVSRYLRVLSQKGLIKVNNITFIETAVDGESVVREATTSEESSILNAESKALEDTGIYYKNRIGYRWGIYKEKVSKNLTQDEEGKHILKYFKMKKIILANKTLAVLAEESRQRLLKSEMNNMVYVSFLECVKRRQKKAINDIKEIENEIQEASKNGTLGFGITPIHRELDKKKKVASVCDNYIDAAQEILLDNVIIKDFKDIESLDMETRLDSII